MKNVNVKMVNGREVLENIKKMEWMGDVFSYLNNLGLEDLFADFADLEVYDAEMFIDSLHFELENLGVCEKIDFYNFESYLESVEEGKYEEEAASVIESLCSLVKYLQDFDRRCVFTQNEYDRSFVKEYTVEDFIFDFEDEILALSK